MVNIYTIYLTITSYIKLLFTTKPIGRYSILSRSSVYGFTAVYPYYITIKLDGFDWRDGKASTIRVYKSRVAAQRFIDDYLPTDMVWEVVETEEIEMELLEAKLRSI